MAVGFREENYLLELPYDAGIHEGFTLHAKDDHTAPRESGWEAFDLQRWLVLDAPEAPGSMTSTTLKFSKARTRTDPLSFVERAYPAIFARGRADHPWYLRPLYSWPVRALLPFISPYRPSLTRTVVHMIRIAERVPETN